MTNVRINTPNANLGPTDIAFTLRKRRGINSTLLGDFFKDEKYFYVSKF